MSRSRRTTSGPIPSYTEENDHITSTTGITFYPNGFLPQTGHTSLWEHPKNRHVVGIPTWYRLSASEPTRSVYARRHTATCISSWVHQIVHTITIRNSISDSSTLQHCISYTTSQIQPQLPVHLLHTGVNFADHTLVLQSIAHTLTSTGCLHVIQLPTSACTSIATMCEHILAACTPKQVTKHIPPTLAHFKAAIFSATGRLPTPSALSAGMALLATRLSAGTAPVILLPPVEELDPAVLSAALALLAQAYCDGASPDDASHAPLRTPFSVVIGSAAPAETLALHVPASVWNRTAVSHHQLPSPAVALNKFIAGVTLSSACPMLLSASTRAWLVDWALQYSLSLQSLGAALRMAIYAHCAHRRLGYLAAPLPRRLAARPRCAAVQAALSEAWTWQQCVSAAGREAQTSSMAECPSPEHLGSFSDLAAWAVCASVQLEDAGPDADARHMCTEPPLAIEQCSALWQRVCARAAGMPRRDLEYAVRRLASVKTARATLPESSWDRMAPTTAVKQELALYHTLDTAAVAGAASVAPEAAAPTARAASRPGPGSRTAQRLRAYNNLGLNVKASVTRQPTLWPAGFLPGVDSGIAVLGRRVEPIAIAPAERAESDDSSDSMTDVDASTDDASSDEEFDALAQPSAHPVHRCKEGHVILANTRRQVAVLYHRLQQRRLGAAGALRVYAAAATAAGVLGRASAAAGEPGTADDALRLRKAAEALMDERPDRAGAWPPAKPLSRIHGWLANAHFDTLRQCMHEWAAILIAQPCTYGLPVLYTYSPWEVYARDVLSAAALHAKLGELAKEHAAAEADMSSSNRQPQHTAASLTAQRFSASRRRAMLISQATATSTSLQRAREYVQHWLTRLLQRYTSPVSLWPLHEGASVVADKALRRYIGPSPRQAVFQALQAPAAYLPEGATSQNATTGWDPNALDSITLYQLVERGSKTVDLQDLYAAWLAVQAGKPQPEARIAVLPMKRARSQAAGGAGSAVELDATNPVLLARFTAAVMNLQAAGWIRPADQAGKRAARQAFPAGR